MKKSERIKEIINMTDGIRDSLIKVVEEGGQYEYQWTNDGLQFFNSVDVGFTKLGLNGAQTFRISVYPYKDAMKDALKSHNPA